MASSIALVTTARCPVCATALEEPLERCPACETPHHRACWEYAGGCALYACTHTAIAPQRREERTREVAALIRRWKSDHPADLDRPTSIRAR